MNNIRWMTRSDLEEVYGIKKACMSGGDLSKHLSSPSFILKVAEREGRVAGFVRYKSCKKTIKIAEIAVSAEFRRMGVATDLINSISRNDKKIEIVVPDSLLEMHCMLKKLGFLAVGIDNSKKDARYRFAKCQKESS